MKKKIVMLGSWGVGKTSLVRQFVENVFDDKYLSTLGVKISKKVITVDEDELTLMLWDIAGAEDHFSVPTNYITGASGFLLVVDGTRRESLHSALALARKVKQEVGDIPFIAVVNKSDLSWQLEAEVIDQAFAEFDAGWMSTSAKTGENVELAFMDLARQVLAQK